MDGGAVVVGGQKLAQDRFGALERARFAGADRFFPVNYKDDWAVVRKVAEASGAPYNRAAYERESAASEPES
jgi:phosphonate transport system substrate-binding protein